MENTVPPAFYKNSHIIFTEQISLYKYHGAMQLLNDRLVLPQKFYFIWKWLLKKAKNRRVLLHTYAFQQACFAALEIKSTG